MYFFNILFPSYFCWDWSAGNFIIIMGVLVIELLIEDLMDSFRQYSILSRNNYISSSRL